MAQDFAKQRSNPETAKRKRAVSKGQPPGTANWSWYFSGLMTGVIISIAAYLGVLKLEEGVVEDPQTVEAGASSEEQPTYSFYEVLSRAEVAVNVPDSAAQGQEGPAADNSAAQASAFSTSPAGTQALASVEEKPTIYLLQAGSFQNKDSATSQRARIILLNMNANVVEHIVGGRTLYSVQVGPFAGTQSAEDAQDILSGSDIDSIKLLAP